jgi:hypothetical protein
VCEALGAIADPDAPGDLTLEAMLGLSGDLDARIASVSDTSSPSSGSATVSTMVISSRSMTISAGVEVHASGSRPRSQDVMVESVTA